MGVKMSEYKKEEPKGEDYNSVEITLRMLKAYKESAEKLYKKALEIAGKKN